MTNLIDTAASWANGGRRVRPDSLSGKSIALCSGPNGASQDEIVAATGCKVHSVGCRLADLVSAGVLFRAGPGWERRYFSTPEARDAWAEVEVPKIESARLEKKRARWRKNDEMRREARLAIRQARPPKPPREPRVVAAKPAKAPMPPKPAKRPKARSNTRTMIIEACAAPQGSTLSELAILLGKHSNTLSAHILNMQREGLMFRGGPRGKGGRHFSKAEHAAAYVFVPASPARDYVRRVKSPAWSLPKGVPLTVAKRCELPPIITPNTKFTKCPHGEDYRFKVDPSIAGKGVISQDYFARRQATA